MHLGPVQHRRHGIFKYMTAGPLESKPSLQKPYNLRVQSGILLHTTLEYLCSCSSRNECSSASAGAYSCLVHRMHKLLFSLARARKASCWLR